MKPLPVYAIPHFQQSQTDLYANELRRHLKDHHFINSPHKHDFYLVVLFTSGTGRHEVDFVPYKVKPGSLFVLKPGQVHSWQLTEDTNGFVFFHSRVFYEEKSLGSKLNDFLFFSFGQQSPHALLKDNSLLRIKSLMTEILSEFNSTKSLRDQKIVNLINLVYIELTRDYR